MSGYTTAPPPGQPGIRNPNIYDTNVTVTTYPNFPRNQYTSGNLGSTPIQKGQYVYPKSGEMVFFFEDSKGTQRQLKNKNQVNDPMRIGNELVGTTTGRIETNTNGTFIEVDWINSYVDHNLFRADERKNDPRKGWVDSSKVSLQAIYQSPEDRENGVDTSDTPPATDGGGLNSTTLGYAAVAAALILGTPKKKKRK